MKKNKLSIIFAILTCICIFSVAAIADQCGCRAIPVEEKIDVEETEEATEEEASTEEEISEETEEQAEETAEEEEEEKEAPTIELQIHEGPTYTDGICYYRIKANVTGNPAPEVEFSKDDSGGAWGEYIVQINLNNPSETHTLVATATNSEGTASYSLNLSWGCEEEPPGGEGGGDGDGEDGIVFEIADFSEMIFNPFDIGYVVYPTGVNTSELIIGDSISNTDVRGFFAFDLITLRGKEIVSATLRLNTYKYYPDPSFKGRIIISFRVYLPLDADDYEVPGLVMIPPFDFDNRENPIEFNLLRSYVQQKVNDSCILGFCIRYEFPDTDWDHEIDGREYSKESIRLTIRYVD